MFHYRVGAVHEGQHGKIPQEGERIMIKVLVEFRMDDLDDREEAEKRINFHWQCRDANIRINYMEILQPNDLMMDCFCYQCGISYPLYHMDDGCPQCGYKQDHTQAFKLLEIMKQDEEKVSGQ